jgi:transcription termination factor NusB
MIEKDKLNEEKINDKNEINDGDDINKISKRELTRLVAIMALYLLKQNDNTKQEVLDHLFTTPILQEELSLNVDLVDKLFLNELLDGAIENEEYLQNTINANITNTKINMENSDQLIFSILHLGAFELLQKNLDKKIVISQYVKLSSTFFEKHETSIINAILDTINIS